MYRRTAAFLCAVMACNALAPAAASAASAQLTSTPEARVLAAMRLWGDIRYFDPELTRVKIDWDQAFLSAEPSIAQASSQTEYRAALTSMLAPLHDPWTSVDRSPTGGAARISVQSTAAGSIITFPAGISANQQFMDADLQKAVAQAKASSAIVFDLRNANVADINEAQAVTYAFSPSSPLVDLWHGAIRAPREREREYLGFPTEGGGYEGYAARDRIDDSMLIKGKSDVAKRIAFLTSSATALPPLVVALAQSGAASIYTTGGQPTAGYPDTSDLAMTDGVTASFRLGDYADIDEHGTFASETADSPEAALRLIASHASAPLTTSPVPAPVTVADPPYAADEFPNLPLRLLAVARVYNVIRYFSPYRELMHDDWDAAALQAIRDETRASNAREYVLALMKFYAHLHDSHGFAVGPVTQREFGAGPPFSARYLHRDAVVTRVWGTAASYGLKAGDIIDTVNGVPVARAMKAIEIYRNDSTQQALDYSALMTAYVPSIFSGTAGSTLHVTFHHPGSARRISAAIVRAAPQTAPPDSSPVVRILPGNVGYVDFDRLEPSQVGAMFEKLRGTRAIIFDNRGYPKGAAWSIAPRLTTKTKVQLALFNTPLVTEPLDTSDGPITALPTYRQFYQLSDTSNAARYLKPTVMLIDERAISQSEHSALFFRAVNGTRFVGTPTRGADGDVTSMVVPGGLHLYFSGEGVRHPDGSQLQRVGIIPDVRVEPTAHDIASGNDVVLQAGLREALRLSHADATQARADVAREGAAERRAFVHPPAPVAVSGGNAQPLHGPWNTTNAKYAGATASLAGGEEISLTSKATGLGERDFGVYSRSLDLAPYLGKTIRIRGMLRTDKVSAGAGFWLRIDGPTQKFDNMHDRWLKATTHWTPFTIVLPVPPDATGAVLGLLLIGEGSVFGKNLTIDVVPNDTPATSST